MTEERIAEAVVDVLREFVEKVRRHVSREVGGVSYHGVDMHGVRSPHASFWLADGDDELVLSVSIRKVGRGLLCDCDLGVHKETFATMPTVTLRDTNAPPEVERLLRAVKDFVVAQEAKAVAVLQQDARCGR